jgi:hypothetical protein
MEKKEINNCCGCCDRLCGKSYNKKDEETIINYTGRNTYKDNYNSNNMSISNNLTNLTNLTNDFEEKNNDLNIYYFGRSGKKYTDEELLKMNIYEISIGFHPTKILNNELISFHPFFYLKLDNEEEIGLVIQYLKLNKDELENTHMYEGIEYLEKDYQMFESELINIFKKINVDFIASKYLIPYNITNMNLRKFSKK